MSRWVERSACFGQNQPISVIASGGIDTGSAQGVKIEPTKNADVTTAQRNGQIDRSGMDPSVIRVRASDDVGDEHLAAVGA